MDNTDNEILRKTLIPAKNYEQLSLGDLLFELHQENRAIAHYKEPLSCELPNAKRSSAEHKVPV